ncbi:MAG: carboxypeptidase regulatory-like domain-containing protein, partial [Planctomycetales bacterium]|nr:carboxypeptidase regulatory-like domain-containing protein [Planctomycetales bacterium]
MNEDKRTSRGDAFVAPGSTEFRISPLIPGRYRVEVTSPEIETITFNHVVAPKDDWEIPVEVRGQLRLTGRVIDDVGQTVQDFRIRVVKVGHLRGPWYVQPTNWRQVTDPAGKFEVDVVGPGIYQVSVLADGWALASSEPLNTDELPTEPIAFQLVRGVTLQGTVVDDAGQPIDGAVVAPQSASPQVLPQHERGFVGDELAVGTVGGKFKLAALPTGKEVLRVTHPDYLPTITEEFELNRDTQLPAIVLRRGATVHGTVYNNAGKPRSGFTVQFHDKYAYSGKDDAQAGLLASVVTDHEGRYETNRLPERLCYVHLEPEWDQDGVVRTAILPVIGKEQTLDLGGPGGIRGKLLVNGVPQANVRLQLSGESAHFGVFRAFTQTNADGEFVFSRPPAGARVLWYQTGDRRSNWIRAGEVTYSASHAADEWLDIGQVDPRSGTVLVNLQGISTDEVANVRLQAIDPNFLILNEVGNQQSRKAADTPFTFDDVAPAELEVSIIRTDGVVLMTPTVVRGGVEPQEITVHWPPAVGTLEVKLGPEFNGSAEIAQPRLRSSDGRVLAYLEPKPGNEPIRLERLPAGDYYLTNQDLRDARRFQSFTISADETTTLDVEASAFSFEEHFGIARIHWYGADGVPLPGVNGSLSSGATAGQVRITKRDAEWTVFGAPGEYSLSTEFP